MNTRLILILSTLLISVVNASAQGVIIQAPGPPARPSDPEASATRFDLDFPGGTPAQLVAAIEKASSIRVNVVIPTEHAAVQLPSLKMKSVTVQQLFMALEAGSQQSNSGYGFRTLETPTERAVWFFYSFHRPATVTCRFYQLAPYLENISSYQPQESGPGGKGLILGVFPGRCPRLV